MSETSKQAGGAGYWAFIVLMLALTGLFIYLGTWQLHRLGEKEHLIAAVAERLDGAPQPFPPADLPLSEADQFNFSPVVLQGHYVPEGTVLVFTSLGEARGRYGGAGYWVVTPFALDDGGAAFINRGFVPQGQEQNFLAKPGVDAEPIQISGIARVSEQVGPFTPEPDRNRHIEWVRNSERLAAFVDPGLGPFSPFYVDLPAGAPGQLPQGGETIVAFPNRHLEYAGTWFAFAVITPIMLGVWMWRQRRKRA